MSREEADPRPASEPEHASGGAPEPAGGDPFGATRASWGFPAFAKDFPRDPELDALVGAFARGDFARVREGAPKLASATASDAVRSAALLLRGRVEPDGSSKLLFLAAAALLAFLTVWWVAHDGPEGATPASHAPQKVDHAE